MAVRDDDGDFGDIGRLRAEADDLARRVTRVQDPAVRFRGADPAGVVMVTVDGNGQVQDVSVGQEWRRVGGSVELAGAVRAAVEAAGLDRLRGLDESLSEQLDAPEPAAGSAAAPSAPGRAGAGSTEINELVASLSEQATSESTLAALREVVQMLEGLDADLDQLSRRVEDQQSRSYEGRSGARHVVVRVTGQGEVVGVEYDSRWLHAAHEYNISRETREAFEAAYRRAGEQTVEGLIADSRIGMLSRLAGDPVELARRLGLHNR